jgi:hypothetical protein
MPVKHKSNIILCTYTARSTTLSAAQGSHTQHVAGQARSRGGQKHLCVSTELLAVARKQCEVDGILHTCVQTTWRSPIAENQGRINVQKENCDFRNSIKSQNVRITGLKYTAFVRKSIYRACIRYQRESNPTQQNTPSVVASQDT